MRVGNGKISARAKPSCNQLNVCGLAIFFFLFLVRRPSPVFGLPFPLQKAAFGALLQLFKLLCGGWLLGWGSMGSLPVVSLLLVPKVVRALAARCPLFFFAHLAY
jgi:hypothetical protein